MTRRDDAFRHSHRERPGRPMWGYGAPMVGRRRRLDRRFDRSNRLLTWVLVLLMCAPIYWLIRICL